MQFVDHVSPRGQTTPTAAAPMAGAGRRSRRRNGAGADFMQAPQCPRFAMRL
jgi:hypothetical protein